MNGDKVVDKIKPLMLESASNYNIKGDIKAPKRLCTNCFCVVFREFYFFLFFVLF
jgi:hypothetical protein